MTFRDQRLVCKECGDSFFWTVTDQRRLADRLGTSDIEAPDLCPKHRKEGQPKAPAAAPEPEVRRQAEPVRAERTEPAPLASAPPSGQGNQVFPHEESGIEVKLIGTVKWFSRRKGYGFITKADGEDLFFHRSEMAEGERDLPNDDQRVEFQIRQTDKGPEAFNVSILPSE